jgi:hypothetical protein
MADVCGNDGCLRRKPNCHGKHSFLGPIDPQLILQTALGNRLVPVQNILEQFERALRDGADPVKLRVWAPMLTQYGPDLLVTCQNLVHGG